MTGLSNKEVAEHWFRVMKSAPYADSWNIEGSFVERLAAIWPWVQVYFDLLDMLRKKPEDFGQATILGVYGLQQTLGLRPDCACTLLILLFLSRNLEQLSSQEKDEAVKQCAALIEQLAKTENEKSDQWLRWFERQWEGECNDGRQQ